MSHRTRRDQRDQRHGISREGIVICPSGKAGLPRHVAEAKLAEYTQPSTRHRTQDHIYQCSHCGAWHLSSRPQRPSPNQHGGSTR